MTENEEIAHEADQLDDEYAWIRSTSNNNNNNPVLGSALKSLEKELRCDICNDFMRAPVSLVACQHTFCSECVRQHFRTNLASTKREAFCPHCGVKIDTPHGCSNFSMCLVPNRSVEAVIKHFRKLRGPLLDTLEKNSNNNHCQESNNNTAAASSADPPKEASADDGSEKRSTRRSRRAPVSYKQESEGDDDDDDDDSVQEVAPPTQQQQQQQKTALKKKNPTFYKTKSKKKLMELCAEEGLSTSGTEAELVARHSSFYHLYLAECDADVEQQRSHEELVQVIADRERQRKAQARKTASDRFRKGFDPVECMKSIYKQLKKLAKDPNAKWGVVLSGNKEFDVQLEENFRDLIAQGRENLRKEKENGDANQPKLNSSGASKETMAPTASASNEEASAATSSSASDQQSLQITNPYVKGGKPFAASALAASVDTAPASAPRAKPLQQAQAHVATTAHDAKPPPALSICGASNSSLAQQHHNNDDAMEPNRSSSEPKQQPLPLSIPRVVSRENGGAPQPPPATTVAFKEKKDDKATGGSSKRKQSLSQGQLKLAAVTKKPRAAAAPSRNSNGRRSIIGKWTCGTCTFINEKNTSSRAKCEMCQSPREASE